MGLNYDEIKAKHNEETVWVSYSDLATVLSVLFLLLYVTSTLRSSSISISEQVTAKKALEDVTEMKKQVHAYDVLKEEYLTKGASAVEKHMYNELLDHMQLLSKETKQEKEELRRRAQENEAKELGLNKYQAMIRNIINANMIAQSQMKKRDKIIEKKSKNITELRKLTREREQQIAKNNKEIEQVQSKLQGSIAQLEKAYKSKAKTKKTMQEEIARLRQDTARKVAALEGKNQTVAQQLHSAKQMIEEKSEELAEKETEVQKLATEKDQISSILLAKQQAYQTSIAKLQQQHEESLAKNRAAFEQSLKQEQLTAAAKVAREKAYREQVEREKLAYDNKMRGLEDQLTGTSRQLASAKETLNAKDEEIAEKNTQVQKLSSEKQKILSDLQEKEGAYQKSMASLQQQYENGMAKSRAAFEQSLKQEQLSASAKIAREKAYRAQVEQDKLAYDQKMRGLEDQLQGTRHTIAQKEAAYRGSLAKMEKSNQGLSRELASVKQRELERKQVIDSIKRNFSNAGINASVNDKTGEVTINFGAEYFDYGSSAMKNGMASILQKAIPTYAQSLFQDKKLAQRISSVEIIGFASPTFRGKYVNPRDLSSESRRAVNYNMDLSYQRAKAMFEYVFDPRRMDYQHQKELLSLAKVSGQSYLRAQGAGAEKLSDDQYCQKFDCTKSQKVVIKFNFAER